MEWLIFFTLIGVVLYIGNKWASDAAGLYNHRGLPIKNATIEEYTEWVRQHGKHTHKYDYPFRYSGVIFNHNLTNITGSHILKFTANCTIKPRYGAHAYSAIVPKGIEVRYPDGLGHIDLYFEEGFRNAGNFVPIYSDMKI